MSQKPPALAGGSSLSDLIDKQKTDAIWDWLHDGNLLNNVYICHYKSDREIQIETTEKKTMLKGIFNRSLNVKTETVIESILFVGFVFENQQDAVNFKLACC